MLPLQQNQLWNQSGRYLRIIRLERLEVEYREQESPEAKSGPPVCVTKKEFCRLIKDAELVS